MRQSIIYGLLYISMNMVPSSLFGQKLANPQADTVKWEYGRGQNKLRSSERLSISGYLISYGGKQLIWIQNGTDRKYMFDVKSTRGEWSNVSENGELLYRAVCNGISGTVRIFREAEQLGIEIDFSQRDKLTPNILLEINTYRKI